MSWPLIFSYCFREGSAGEKNVSSTALKSEIV